MVMGETVGRDELWTGKKELVRETSNPDFEKKWQLQ